MLKSAFFLHRLGWYVPTFLKRYRHNEEGTHTHIKKTESASEHVEIKFERYLGHYNTRQLAAAQNAHATQLEVAPERKKKTCFPHQFVHCPLTFLSMCLKPRERRKHSKKKRIA